MSQDFYNGLSLISIVSFWFILIVCLLYVYFSGKNYDKPDKKGNHTVDSKLQREAENQQVKRLNDLLNTLRASSEDATVSDRQFRSRFEHLTENINDDPAGFQEKPKRNYRLTDDGEFEEGYD